MMRLPTGFRDRHAVSARLGHDGQRRVRAWVLWNDVTHLGLRDEPSSSLILLGAAPSYQQCEQIRIARAKSLLHAKQTTTGPNVDRVTVEENGNIVTETTYLKDGRSRMVSQRLSCLPDTVDPRGPKGK